MGCCSQTPSPKAALQSGGSPAGPSPLLSQGCCRGSFCWDSSCWRGCSSFTPPHRSNHTCPLVSPRQPCPVSELPYQPRLFSLMCSSPEAVSVLGSRTTSLPSALASCHATEALVYLFSRNWEVLCLPTVCLGKRSGAGALGELQLKQREGGDNCWCSSPCQDPVLVLPTIWLGLPGVQQKQSRKSGCRYLRVVDDLLP